ncbi:MAG TPA: hypothetical protein VIY49_21935 [Bryobacteraceae bacterium]
MDELARARDEIRRGDYTSAQTILDGIPDGPDEITSHLLFDIACAYEELFNARGRYKDLITACRSCAAKTERLSPLDAQIHSAHTLIVIAELKAPSQQGRNRHRRPSRFDC